MCALAGLGLGIAGLLAGAAVLAAAGGNLANNFVLDAPALNAFGIGLFALVLGPVAYFLGKAANVRSTAILGVVATALGAASGLLWLVIMLLGYFGPPPA